MSPFHKPGPFLWLLLVVCAAAGSWAAVTSVQTGKAFNAASKADIMQTQAILRDQETSRNEARARSERDRRCQIGLLLIILENVQGRHVELSPERFVELCPAPAPIASTTTTTTTAITTSTGVRRTRARSSPASRPATSTAGSTTTTRTATTGPSPACDPLVSVPATIICRTD